MPKRRFRRQAFEDAPRMPAHRVYVVVIQVCQKAIFIGGKIIAPGDALIGIARGGEALKAEDSVGGDCKGKKRPKNEVSQASTSRHGLDQNCAYTRQTRHSN
jgi:hypothetical protein